MKKGILFFGLVGLMTSACIKHEVIPPPTPTVDLEAHFIGDIQGTPLELTENVNGYSLESTQTKVLTPAPDLSSATYFAKMGSTTLIESIQIGHGSVMWNSSSSNVPSLEQFNNFHLNTLLPQYSTTAITGFEVVYKDPQNRTWTSDENSVNVQNVEFLADKSIQESDDEGDYAKFVCEFNCYVYHYDTDLMQMDSLHITNAVFKGWFKR